LNTFVRPVGSTDALASRQAFDRLFLAEYARVVNIANRVLADPAEAEDVAQEVFIAYSRKHSPLADFAPAWLHRAAWHAALNRVRGRRRRNAREAGTVVTDAGLDPADAVVDADQRRLVREAMARLPEKQAAVLALRYSGLSYAEVAGSMGVRIGQVGTMLRRAEARLRQEVSR